MKLENEISTENISETVVNENINQINDQYHEELLKNQEAQSIVENSSEDEEVSFLQEAVEISKSDNEPSNDLKEFGVDSKEPDLFNSENQTSGSEDLLGSSEEGNDEDDLEIPAFLRRQKN